MKKFFNKKPFFIAEISANHCGSINKAKKLIITAKKNGADAVKLQTYTPDMMTLKTQKFIIKKGLWRNKNLWKLYKEAQTPLEWHKELFSYAKKLNMKIFSTPFTTEAVDFLEKLNCKAYKIASFEMNDLNLIKRVSRTRKPIIISTGLASLNEIEESVKMAKMNGCSDITLLYCVSNYPSSQSDFNLNNIKILKDKFNCRVGLSDHSIGNDIAKLSIALGAEIFEKHIALKNQKKGHDIKFSAKGSDIKIYKDELVKTSKLFEKCSFIRNKKEMENLIFRRSIYAKKNIEKDDIFTDKNIYNLRPDIGLGANFYPFILGKKSPIIIKKGSVLNKSILKKIKKNSIF